MKPTAVVDIAALYGAKTLAGTVAGKAFLPTLLAAVAGCPQGSVVALDLRQTDLVTASFFRASFKPLRDYSRMQANLHLVHVCSANSTLEEVQAYAEDVGDVFLFSNMDARGEFAHPFVIGTIEAKQQATLIALGEVGEADAPTLLKRFPDPFVSSPNAWNNRLAALSDKGLVVARVEGRSKFYRPIFKEIRLGL